jgi:hypothetical protein
VRRIDYLKAARLPSGDLVEQRDTRCRALPRVPCGQDVHEFGNGYEGTGVSRLIH